LDTATSQSTHPACDTTKWLAVPYPNDTGAVQLLFSSPENFGLCTVRRSYVPIFEPGALNRSATHPTK